MKRDFMAATLILAAFFMTPARGGSPATELLLKKARALDARGRLDLASQSWQQVLIVDPNDTEALAGLARAARQAGKMDESKGYLERLRKIDPNHPALTQVESVKVLRQQRARLAEAERLAGNQQYEQAMRVYREVFGDEPPAGGWALAYYETEAATPGGWDHATAGVRRLFEKQPDAQEYRLALGRLLTYRPASRLEGMRLLEGVQGDGELVNKARQAWRQALVWEGANPAGAASLRAYLARYPDPELQKVQVQVKQAEVARVSNAGGRDEQLGYEALKAGNLKAAENSFAAALRVAPKSPGALAGLGYVRMKQENFADAVRYFEESRAADSDNKQVQEALETARFWKNINEGGRAHEANRLDAAIAAYQAALNARPANPDALQGLAGALMRKGDAAAAAPVYEKLVAVQPENAEGWRGLVAARHQSAGSAGALAAAGRVPPKVAPKLARDIEYQAMLASAYGEAGRPVEFRRALLQAREAAGADGKDVPLRLQVRLARMLLQYGQPEQAANEFQRVVDLNPGEIDGWEGLIEALVRTGNQARALAVLDRVPKDTYDAALRRPPFIRAVATVYAAAGRLEVAEASLLKAVEIESEGGAAPGADTVLQLADIWQQQNKTDKAEDALRKLTDATPENPEAWKALVNLLNKSKRHGEAIAETQRIPPATAAKLLNEPGYVSLLASAYSATGSYDEAFRLIRGASARAELEKRPIPTDLDIQMCWLLLNSRIDERQLYSLLARSGARADLTPAQQKEIAEIWSVWSRRRALQARAAGDPEDSVSILAAAARLLPSDYRIWSALSGTLIRMGDARRALAVYKTWRLVNADPADYAGAIGSAMAERNQQLAGAWLREALAKWPQDSNLLALAGKQAALRNDFKKAEAYWRAALGAAPGEGALMAAAGGQTPLSRGRQEQIEASRSLGRMLVPANELPELDSALGSGMDSFQDSVARPDTNLGLSAAAAPRRENGFGSHPPAAAQRSEIPFEAPATTLARPDTAFGLPSSGRVARAENGFTPDLDLRPARSSRTEAAAFLDGYQPKSQNEEIAEQIAAIETRNSPYFGSEGSFQSRSGRSGFERLTSQEAVIEASTAVGNHVRVGLQVRPVYLDAGSYDGMGELRLGLAPATTPFPSQTVSGLRAQAEVSTQNFGLMVGSSPRGFLVTNVIGGLRYRPAGGPITLMATRDSLKDTMLSYAGMQDPVSHQVWGGVIANTFSLVGNWGDEYSGFYAQGGFQTISGKSVARNTRMDATAGTYWKVMTRETGALTLGLNLTTMHYDKNLRFFTLGHGGYFSPQRYFLFNLPAHWTGKWKNQFDYSVTGSLGSQYFQEDASPYFPTLPLLQGRAGPYYPKLSSTGANYSLEAKGAYQLSPNWIMGGFLGFNNARNYATGSAGFYVKYLFSPRPMRQELTVPSIPDWKGAQPFMLRNQD